MKKIRTNVLLLWIVISASVVGCQKSDQSDSVPIKVNYLWEQQLDKVLHAPHELLVKSNIRLTSYEVLDVVDSPDKVARYAALLKSEKPMLPYYSQGATKSGSNDVKISTISKAEAEKQTKSGTQSYSFGRSDRAIDSLMSQGDLRILRLTWDNNGTKTESLCAVSDKTGIAYDHFMSNIIIVNKPIITEHPTPEYISSSKSDNEYGDQQLYTGPKKWSYQFSTTYVYGLGAGGPLYIWHDAEFQYGRLIGHKWGCWHMFSHPIVCHVKATELFWGSISYAWGVTSYEVGLFILYDGYGYSLRFGHISGYNMGEVGSHSFY